MERGDGKQDGGRAIILALATLLVVCLASLILAVFGLAGLSRAKNSLDDAYHRHQQLEALFDSLQDAETGARGFIITGNDIYLAPYNRGLANLPGQLAALKATTKGLEYEPQVAQIEALAQIKADHMQDMVRRRREEGLDAAIAATDTGTGKQLMDQIREQVNTVEARQAQDERRQRERAAHFSLLTSVVLWVAMAVVAGLVALVYWFYRRAMEARRHLDRAKDEFVSLASHQLRTPATGIKSILSMLKGGDFGPLSERQHHFVGRAIESNERELSIIEELLNVAKADAGRLVLKPIDLDLRELIRAIIGEQSRIIASKKITLKLRQPDKPVPLRGDEEKLYMALANLLDNARKYTPEGGEISVTLERHRGNIRIAIADSGIGIEEAEITRIFDRFQRASNAMSGHAEGTGLGLYLARRIVQLHNGSIEVQSKKGQGSRFIMILPERGV